MYESTENETPLTSFFYGQLGMGMVQMVIWVI